MPSFSSTELARWEIVGEAVRAANSAEGFTGEDSRLMLRLQTSNMTSMQTHSAENFDVPAYVSGADQRRLSARGRPGAKFRR